MTLRHLILKEMLHRKLNSGLSLFSVMAAAGCLVASLLLLKAFDLRTETLIAEKEAALEKQMAEMENEYRKITKRMGFNILILPKKQNLSDFYAENYATEFMPEDYAHTLADAKNIVTIRHLLPMLQQKREWPEQKRKILLIGVQGEMTWAHRTSKPPILKPVPPGTVAVGYELHHSLGLKEGDALTFMGKSFKVKARHPERGTIDDITLWIDLKEAQALLEKEGLINSMVALECKCAFANLPKVRAEIQKILPETQVVELAGRALARAEARTEAERNAKLAIAREKQGRIELRKKRQAFIAVLVPLVIAACAIWVGLLAFSNVRERRVEIAILRALGLRTWHILFVFLGKAGSVGLAGGILGILLGTALGLGICERPEGASPATMFLGGVPAVAILLLTPVVTILASWVPALLAAQQEPATVLREE